MSIPYTHTKEIHNMTAPREIVHIVNQMIQPKSIVDIGCGLGNFLKAFKELGVKEVLGIDGKWCNKEFLFENINPSEFLELDMEKAIQLQQKYDLAVCLEVAEHLFPQRAESFVIELTQMSDVILFSAAIPGQGGDHHYNEQWLDYWVKLFSKNNYELHDILRPHFWNNKKIHWWYRQNMVLFTKKGYTFNKNIVKNTHIENMVHPELFNLMINYRNKNAIKRYLKLISKAFLYRIRLIK